jgi:hypothetical protein
MDPNQFTGQENVDFTQKKAAHEKLRAPRRWRFTQR